jgi:hypothetical protein
MASADRDDRDAIRAGLARTGPLLVTVVVVSFAAAALVGFTRLAAETAEGPASLRLEGGPSERSQLPAVPRPAARAPAPARRRPAATARLAGATRRPASVPAPVAAVATTPAPATGTPAAAPVPRTTLPAGPRAVRSAPASAGASAPTAAPTAAPRLRLSAPPSVRRPSPRRATPPVVDVPVATVPPTPQPAAPAVADDPGAVAQAPVTTAAADEAEPGAVTLNTR